MKTPLIPRSVHDSVQTISLFDTGHRSRTKLLAEMYSKLIHLNIHIFPSIHIISYANNHVLYFAQGLSCLLIEEHICEYNNNLNVLNLKRSIIIHFF